MPLQVIYTYVVQDEDLPPGTEAEDFVDDEDEAVDLADYVGELVDINVEAI